MSTRVTAAADFVAEVGIAVTTAARVSQVSRRVVFDRLRPESSCEPGSADGGGGQAAGHRSRRAAHTVAPVLLQEWRTMDLGPEHCAVATAIQVLMHRHPAGGYRKITVRSAGPATC